MINLDDENIITKYDKSNQIAILLKWSDLIREAKEECLKFKIPNKVQWKNKTIEYRKPNNVIICGMGASAIAGDYLISLFRDEFKVPVITDRKYHLPNFANENTLVVCISYSGNTEETLSRYQDALVKGAMLVSISSSGLLEKLSNSIGTPHIKIREGLPPRSSLPSIYISLIKILEKFELLESIDQDIVETAKILEGLAKQYSPETNKEENIAKKTAYSLFNTLPLFIGHTIYSPIAFRGKCEFNENSKVLAISDVLPEQNHNGIVAWDNPNTVQNDVFVIFFRDKNEQKQIKTRVEETINTISQKTEKILEIFPQGNSNLTKQITATYLIDFISIYLGILHELDPSSTPSIDKLKEVLKKKTNLQEKIEKQLLS